jgi:8-oxo-dGTP pyrophosphatase MutT (NUDIX family)
MKNYNIFYNQNVLSIKRLEQFDITSKENKNCFIFNNSLNIEKIILRFFANKQNICILYENEDEKNILWEEIKSFFIFQRAAGGVILKNNSILSIYRYEHWDFPKGHVEAGETDEETAMREVTEETGIDKLVITKDLCYTYHIFPFKNDFVLKETHWYEMHTASGKKPVPQTEESILQTEWIPLQNLNIIRRNTYPALVELIDRCFSQCLYDNKTVIN